MSKQRLVLAWDRRAGRPPIRNDTLPSYHRQVSVPEAKTIRGAQLPAQPQLEVAHTAPPSDSVREPPPISSKYSRQSSHCLPDSGSEAIQFTINFTKITPASLASVQVTLMSLS